MNLNVVENNKREKRNCHIGALCRVARGGGSHPEHLSRGFLRPRWHRCRMLRFHGCFPALRVIHTLICTDIPGWMLPTSAD